MDNVEVWPKVCLPAIRTTQVQHNYQGKAVFEHAKIRLLALNELLLGCERLTDWLKKKCCVFATYTFDDNLCVWRRISGNGNEV